MTSKSSVADVDHHVDPTDFAAAPVNAPLKPEEKIKLLTDMNDPFILIVIAVLLVLLGYCLGLAAENFA